MGGNYSLQGFSVGTPERAWIIIYPRANLAGKSSPNSSVVIHLFGILQEEKRAVAACHSVLHSSQWTSSSGSPAISDLTQSTSFTPLTSSV